MLHRMGYGGLRRCNTSVDHFSVQYFKTPPLTHLHKHRDTKTNSLLLRLYENVNNDFKQLTTMGFPKKNETPKENNEQKTEEQKPIYVDGLMVFEPHRRAPDFVLCDIVLNVEKFEAWVKENPDAFKDDEKYGKQLRLTMKNGKKGYYLTVNTYAK